MCSVFFNNASGENFLKVAKILEYDELTISQVKIEIAPRTKTSKEAQADYYVCDFSYEELSNEERLINQNIIESIGKIYRRDTIDSFDAFISSYNYPTDIINACLIYDPANETAEAQIRRIEAISEEFEPLENRARKVLKAA
jgi:hypothetical protein